MKKHVSLLLAVLLVLTMTACQSAGEPLPTNPPGSNGPSKPLSKEPPALKILDSTGTGIEALVGTYSWKYDTGNGKWTAVEADSAHPLECRELLVPMNTADETVELFFDVSPQDITVRCWRDIHFGDPDASGEYLYLNGNTLELKAGGYIYEVCANWTGDNLAASGTVHYCFYVICQPDDHEHEPAEEPQIVDDPVSGYCGNTMTTINLDGKSYLFAGSDSVNLTDILINLKYDPMKVCRCAPEFEVTTEFDGPHGVNLSQGYARCEDGQADLTAEQVAQIRKILDKQT